MVAELLVATAVFVGLNVYVNNARFYTQFHEVVTQLQLAVLNDPDAAYDILILGDSAGLHGVAPSVMDSALGMTTANLCTNAGLTAYGHALVLQNYLSQHRMPRAVVLVLEPSSYAYEVNFHAARPAGFPLTAYSDYLARASLPDVLDALEYSYFRLCADHEFLADAFRFPWRESRSDAMRRTVTALRQDGYFAIPDSLHRPAAVAAGLRRQLRRLAKGDPVSVSNELGVGRLVDMACREGFRLYVAPGPVHVGVGASADYASYRRYLVDHLRGAAESCDSVRVIATEPPSFPSEAFYDEVTHLCAGPSRDYTEWLAREVAGAMSRLPTHADAATIAASRNEDDPSERIWNNPPASQRVSVPGLPRRIRGRHEALCRRIEEAIRTREGAGAAPLPGPIEQPLDVGARDSEGFVRTRLGVCLAM